MPDYTLAPANKKSSITPYTIRGRDIVSTVLREIEKIVDADYKGNTRLKILRKRKVNDRIIAGGSSPLILPLVQQIFAPNYRVARPEDIQRILNGEDTLPIEPNHYVDMGIALNFTGINHEMALDFYNQLPPKLKKLEGLPAIVIGYGLKNLENADNGLGFVYTPKTQVRPARIISQKTKRFIKFNNKDVSLENGLPTKWGIGKRYFYVPIQQKPSVDALGVSRLELSHCGNYVNASNSNLVDSGGLGLVILF